VEKESGYLTGKCVRNEDRRIITRLVRPANCATGFV
jgi:hypothetical protein